MAASFIICAVSTTHAYELELAWDANSENDVAGYRIYCGTASREYTIDVDVGNQATGVLPDLKPNTTYYLAVTAYDTNQNESDFSEEIVYQTTSSADKDLQIIMMMINEG